MSSASGVSTVPHDRLRIDALGFTTKLVEKERSKAEARAIAKRKAKAMRTIPLVWRLAGVLAFVGVSFGVMIGGVLVMQRVSGSPPPSPTGAAAGTLMRRSPSEGGSSPRNQRLSPSSATGSTGLSPSSTPRSSGRFLLDPVKDPLKHNYA